MNWEEDKTNRQAQCVLEYELLPYCVAKDLDMRKFSTFDLEKEKKKTSLLVGSRK